ncbi:hypothetical protein Taro_008364 [Colocasia esculenta]|uniref:Uncharacterized protein n=1 Tax=Colocasia esculenta TaxID=4460 RepID=A0A843U358_COLES|nr:hypothetical protein [Colocasia esculenta]
MPFSFSIKGWQIWTVTRPSRSFSRGFFSLQTGLWVLHHCSAAAARSTWFFLSSHSTFSPSSLSPISFLLLFGPKVGRCCLLTSCCTNQEKGGKEEA